MRQFLFVSAFTVSLTVITPAMAQPWPSGIGSGSAAYPSTAAPDTTPVTEAIPLPVTNGEISRQIPTGATIPGENNGSMKIGAIITGEHSA